MQSRDITTFEVRQRLKNAEQLCHALAEAHCEDAAAICAAFMDDVLTEGPGLSPFGDLRADAAFWADCAQPPELEAYFYAVLKRLENIVLGIEARKRLFKALWSSFSQAERSAFLRHVNGRAA
jgi:hypothetical protein